MRENACHYLGSHTKGAAWKPIEEIAELRAKNGAVRGGVADGRPSLERVEQACEALRNSSAKRRSIIFWYRLPVLGEGKVGRE